MSPSATTWGTPPQITRAIREAFNGVIDLDPCSTDANNTIVQAANYYTPAIDGLKQEWWGRTFLNPPFARNEINKWITKLLLHWEAGDLKAWISLTDAVTETVYGQALLRSAHMVCFPSGRIKFLDLDLQPRQTGKRPQMLCAAGVDRQLFKDVFEDFGRVLEVPRS